MGACVCALFLQSIYLYAVIKSIKGCYTIVVINCFRAKFQPQKWITLKKFKRQRIIIRNGTWTPCNSAEANNRKQRNHTSKTKATHTFIRKFEPIIAVLSIEKVNIVIETVSIHNTIQSFVFCAIILTVSSVVFRLLIFIQHCSIDWTVFSMGEQRYWNSATKRTHLQRRKITIQLLTIIFGGHGKVYKLKWWLFWLDCNSVKWLNNRIQSFSNHMYEICACKHYNVDH